MESRSDELMDEDYVQCLMSLDTNSRPNPILSPHNHQSATLSPHNPPNNPNIQNPILAETELPLEDYTKEPVLGMVFESDEAAKGFYNEYARRLGFPFRVGRSRRSKGAEEVVIMKRFVCSKEGVYRKKISGEEGTRKRERISMREGCKAFLEVIRESPTRWVISKLENTHNHKLGNCNRVGYLRSRGSFLDPTSSDAKPNFSSSFLHGNSFGEGGNMQDLLEFFVKKQCENPNFFYALHVDSNSCPTNYFWADARSRDLYKYFGDAVTFDTTYKKNKYMNPFVVFSGINHHLQPVIFGCGLLTEETEFSLEWLFETWVAAMGGKAPISIITDQNRAVTSAVNKVFPNTRHRFCKWLILGRTKQKLAHLYNMHVTLRDELETCVVESKTVNSFEASWVSIVERYELRKNTWLQVLFDIRQKWVPLYLKDTFFGEMDPNQKMETVNDFYKKHFNSRTSLKVFLTQFDLAMTSRFEEEAMADLDSLRSPPALKTASLIEKQAARVYTKAVFSKFQEEFTQSLGYVVQKTKDIGCVSKYSVNLDEDTIDKFFVTYNSTRKTAECSCNNFSFCGILCRHIFAVLLIVDPRLLPNEYFLKRWSKNAKNDIGENNRGFFEESVNFRFSDLCSEAVMGAERGACSVEMFRNAKDVLGKAYEEIIALEKEANNKVVHRDPNPININEEITIDDAMNDQMQESERKVTNLLGHLLSSSWSPV